MDRSFAEKTSADDKSIGFDYQYYYFLDKLLNLKVGQSAGLEVKDDVHTQLNQDVNILYQLKHTVKKNAAGQGIALRQLDPDLWKTISNWSKIISDPAQNRILVTEQLGFIKNSEFHLVSNKTASIRNIFLKRIEDYQSGACSFDSLAKNIADLEEETKDITIKGYIKSVKKLDQEVQAAFFRKIYFELDLDDVIAKVKRSILEKAIDADRVDSTFERLDSNVRQDNFLAIKNGSEIVITFEQFMQRYRKVFEDSRSKKLKYSQFKSDLPADIFAQNFVKKLIEIEDIAKNDSERAIDYTTYKLQLANHLRSWVQSGELVTDDVQALHEEVVVRWKNEFYEAYRDCAPHDVPKFARAMLSVLRREKFQLGQTELSTLMSNGELYYLSDDEKIGWHKEWRKIDV